MLNAIVESLKHLIMRSEGWDKETEDLMDKMRRLVARCDEEEEEEKRHGLLDIPSIYRNGVLYVY